MEPHEMIEIGQLPCQYAWVDTSRTPAHSCLMASIEKLIPATDSLRILDIG